MRLDTKVAVITGGALGSDVPTARLFAARAPPSRSATSTTPAPRRLAREIVRAAAAGRWRRPLDVGDAGQGERLLHGRRGAVRAAWT
jgi:hypothetical protein